MFWFAVSDMGENVWQLSSFDHGTSLLVSPGIGIPRITSPWNRCLERNATIRYCLIDDPDRTWLTRRHSKSIVCIDRTTRRCDSRTTVRRRGNPGNWSSLSFSFYSTLPTSGQDLFVYGEFMAWMERTTAGNSRLGVPKCLNLKWLVTCQWRWSRRSHGNGRGKFLACFEEMTFRREYPSACYL